MTTITSVRPTSTPWLRPAMAVATLLSLVLYGAGLGAAPSATPRLDWLFDGGVTATTRIGNVLYVGGGFRNVSPTGTALGYLVAVSPTTGAADPGFAPANSPVSAAESDGGGGYFIAQATSAILTQASDTKIVHIRPDGSVDPAFSSAAIAGRFHRLVRVGPSLVVAGFSRISSTGIDVGGVVRPLVALNPASGALSPWAPVLPGTSPKVVDLEADNGRLFVLSSPALFSDGRHLSAFDSVTGALLWTVQVDPETTQYPFFKGGGLAVAGTRLVVGTDTGIRSLDVSTGAVDPAWGGPVTGATVLEIAVSATTVFVGGEFTQFMGAARSNLAALDLTTGALTAWSPPASLQARSLTASPSGSLFVSLVRANPGGLFNVQSIAEIDATGAFTPWVTAYQGSILEVSPSGMLLISTGTLVTTGGSPRRGLAAFDATTGVLLPTAPMLDAPLVNGFDSATVSGLVTDGQMLYISGTFTSVNGVAREHGAAVDTFSNTVLPWTLASPAKVVLAQGGRVYTAMSISELSWTVRRYDGTSGVPDSAWLPPPLVDLVAEDGSLVAATPLAPGGVGSLGAAIGQLSPVSGQFLESFRTTAVVMVPPGGFKMFGGRLALDGDTAYLAGALPDLQLQYTQRDLADTVVAFDRKTGMKVAPSLRGYINGVTVVDGRLIPFGGRVVLNASERVELAEVSRPGGFTAWTSGWPWRDTPLYFGALPCCNYVRGVTGVSVAGDLLVTWGLATGLPGLDRLTAHPLLGQSVPSRLRSQTSGPNTIFSWDPMAVAPAGGYVIEGGLAAGQTAGALPVGNATSVALPMPAGPAFIRVRAAGSAEVSNEVVAGCVAPPLPPTALTTTLSGINLSLAWTAPAGAVTGYTLQAGTATGLSNVATLALGPQPSISGPVAGGTFFARVTASNACGTSGPSGEVFFTIGAPDPLPAAPTNLTSSLSGNSVSLSWTAPVGAVTGYVLEAGTGAGLANLGTLRVGATTSLVVPGVPAGTYVLRVRAITSAGSGAPSADVVAVVP